MCSDNGKLILIYMLHAEAFQLTVWHSCRMVNFLEPQGVVPQALTLFGGVRFIAWHLWRWGPMHFWECRTRLGSRPAPGPTLKKALYTLVRWWVGQQILLDQPLLCAEDFQLSSIRVRWLISQSLRGPSPPGFNPLRRG